MVFGRFCCCCCWPVSKCAQALAIFDTAVVSYFAYQCGEILFDNLNNAHWTSYVAFLFFFAFAFCQILAAILLFMAGVRKNASYCLPRLVLIAGLAICSIIAFSVVIYYLFGDKQSVNKLAVSGLEYLTGDSLSEVDKVELKHQFIYYSIIFLLLSVIYFVYNIFAFRLTRKYQSILSEFAPVPTAPPQPSFNPDYVGQQGKMNP